MEVIIPTPSLNFDFNEAHPLSFLSAPSTPKRFGDYFMSAPTSPSRVSEFYRYLEEEEVVEDEGGGDERLGSPKSPKEGSDSNAKEDAFSFRFSFKLGKVSLSTADAEELFDGGRIRILKPSPGSLNMQVENDPFRSSLSSPRSPISQGKRKKETDPAGNTMKGMETNERGRGLSSNCSGRGGTRSLSPYRVSGYTWDEVEDEQHGQQRTTKQPSLESKTSVSSTSKSSSRKWRLTDLLLFRSASEGRASDKYHFWKYPGAGLFKSNKHHEEVKSSSFRSVESSGSVSKTSRRKPSMSAHELHYTLNKAASEELKKRTFLPYKHRIFGGF